MNFHTPLIEFCIAVAVLGPIVALCIWNYRADRAHRASLSETERRRLDAETDDDVANW
jgi:hypothetical protein